MLRDPGWHDLLVDEGVLLLAVGQQLTVQFLITLILIGIMGVIKDSKNDLKIPLKPPKTLKRTQNHTF